MFGRHNIKLQLIQVEYQWWIQDFPAPRAPTPKTAWKWKNLNPRGIPGTPLDLPMNILQQECIPVGYVPSAAVSVLGGVCPGGVYAEKGCLSRGCLPGGYLPRGWCLPRKGVSTQKLGWILDARLWKHYLSATTVVDGNFAKLAQSGRHESVTHELPQEYFNPHWG